MRSAGNHPLEIDKVAALIGFNKGDTFKIRRGIRKKTGGKSMNAFSASESIPSPGTLTIEKLKADFPGIYDEAMHIGEQKERKRVSAHIKAGERTGNIDPGHLL